MPVVTVRLPSDAFDADAKQATIAALTEVIADAEGIPADPARRTGIIVIWDELPAGSIHSNATAVDGLAVPIFVWIEPPAGVLDEERTERFVAGVDRVLRAGYRGGAMLFTSVIVRPVADGSWGREGRVWHLADFAATAGYQHLQHLVAG